MKMKRFSAKPIFAIILLCVFCAMLVMTFLTPMLADDFSYSFSYADRSKRIESIADIFPSMAAHRQSMNGRVFSHSLAQLFLMLPKMVFNIFNALNAVVLVCLVRRYFHGRSEKCGLVLVLCGLFMVWQFIPAFGQNFLWLDGSLNYSWAVSFVLAFIWPFFAAYFGNGFSFNPIISALFVLFSFVAGGYSESTSCAALFIAFCFALLLYIRERQLPWQLIASFLSACLGFLFMMLAPSELNGRTASFSFGEIAHNIQWVFMATQEELLPLYCISAVLFVIAAIVGIDRKRLISAAIFFLGSIVSVAVFIFAAYLPLRAFCSTTFFLVISTLILLEDLFEKGYKLIAPSLCAVFGIMFIFSFVLAVGDIGVVYYESLQREKTIQAALDAGENTVTIYNYSGNTKYCGSYSMADASGDISEWPNPDIAAYYGFDYIIGVPTLENYFEPR